MHLLNKTPVVPEVPRTCGQSAKHNNLVRELNLEAGGGRRVMSLVQNCNFVDCWEAWQFCPVHTFIWLPVCCTFEACRSLYEDEP